MIVRHWGVNRIMLKACKMRRSGQEVKPNDHSGNVYYQLIYEHTINDTYECSKF